MENFENKESTVQVASEANSFHDKILNHDAINNSKRRKVFSLIIFYLTCATVFLTIIGQISVFTSAGITKAFQIGWIVLLLPMLILDYRLLLRSFINSFILFIPFLIYCLVALCLKTYPLSYQGTTNILLCLFIFALGVFFGRYFNIHFLKYVSLMFIGSAIIYGITAYILKLRGNIGAKEVYAFDDKNSAGPIFLIAGILSLFVFNKNKVSHYIIKITIFTAFSLLIVIAKCRASIVCIPVVLLMIHIFLPKGRKSKILSRSIFPIAMALGIMLLFAVPFLYEKIVLHFFLNDKATLQEAFSGRLELIQKALKLLNNGKTIIIGTGGYYVDCSPVSLLVSYGVFGVICILPFIIIPWYSIIKARKQINNSKFFIIELCVLLVLYINSLFEGYGFFGPGSKVFFMWLISGYCFYKLIKFPELEPKLVNFQDKPALFVSSIKPKPFSVLFQIFIIIGSIIFVSSQNTISNIGSSIYEVIPKSTNAVGIESAKNMCIDTKFLQDQLGFVDNKGTLCVGQRIKLKDTWDSKGDGVKRAYSKFWLKQVWKYTAADACEVDKFTGVVTALKSSTQDSIITCRFSNYKTFEKDERPYLQIQVALPKDYKFENAYIDIEPFKHSFDVSEKILNGLGKTKANPIPIKKNMTAKVFYDNYYVPANPTIQVSYNIDSSNTLSAKISEDGIITADGDVDTTFKVNATIKGSDGAKEHSSKNELFFIITKNEESFKPVEDFQLNLPDVVYQHTPLKISAIFNNSASDKTFDIKITDETASITEDDYKIEYDENSCPTKITFNKSGNIKIAATSRSNPEKKFEKYIKVTSNAPKEITCDLDHMWMKTGERKTAAELGLKIKYENGYEKVLDDSDLLFDIENEYYKQKRHLATTTKNGFYDGNITNVAAVTPGKYSFTFVSKESPNVKYDLNITCSALSYADYHQLSLNVGIVTALILLIIASTFLLGINIRNKITYSILAFIFGLTVSLIIILAYPLNIYTIVCASIFAGVVILLSFIRLVFMHNKNINYIESIDESHLSN